MTCAAVSLRHRGEPSSIGNRRWHRVKCSATTSRIATAAPNKATADIVCTLAVTSPGGNDQSRPSAADERDANASMADRRGERSRPSADIFLPIKSAEGCSALTHEDRGRRSIAALRDAINPATRRHLAVAFQPVWRRTPLTAGEISRHAGASPARLGPGPEATSREVAAMTVARQAESAPTRHGENLGRDRRAAQTGGDREGIDERLNEARAADI